MILPWPRLLAWGAALLLALGAAVAAADVRVEIEGLDGDERENVRARLGLRVRAENETLDAAQVRRLHEHAPDDIRGALQPFGYYAPEIESSLEGRDPDWVARYRVERGPATRVSAIDTRFEGEGSGFDPLEDRLRGLPLKLDERLRHADYEATKKRMSDAAAANGFLDARWKVAELRVEPAKREAQAILHLDTGPRYFFGPVSIEQEGLDPDFVSRYVDIRPGSPFDPQKLLDLQFRLSDLGYFQAVEIDPRRDEADAQRRVPVYVRTTPRPRTRYDFGVGYGTDTGARVSLGTDWRRLNRHGHTINTDFRLSEIKNTLGGEYKIPLGGEPGESLSFTATAETEQLEDGDTRKYTIGTALNRQPGDWTRKLYVEFAHEESDFGDTFTTADLLTPGLALTRSVSDDPIYTRKGWYVFGDVHGAVRNMLSSTSFLQVRGVARGVYSPLWRLRFIARAEMGWSIVEAFGELPASQRFFAGGDQSVRGYAYQSLGPRDGEGNVVGGKYLSVFSGEAEYRVWHNWGAAVFMDAGGADDDPGPVLNKSVGVGLRYRAPIGSLQLDLAHPLDGDEPPIRVHIGIRVGV
jgi:translocation and assembly module TamA